MYGDTRGERPYLGEVTPVPYILKREVEKALGRMKWRKAEGSDGVVVEMVEAAGEFAIEKITELANKVYRTGIIPKRMEESEFIVLPIKEGATECSTYRAISIMSQVAKVILKVMDDRLNKTVEEHVDKAQFGFRKGKRTGNAIFVLRAIIERAIEKQKDLYLCFIDFDKAFNMVRYEVLVERLRGLGIDVPDLTLITNLYLGQIAVVKVGDDKSEWANIERGVRQGCVLSPDLFSLYSKAVINELEDIESVKVGGSNINHIRYADDTVLITDTNAKLQSLVDKLDVECNRMGLKINISKTEVIGITKNKGQVRVVVNVGGQTVKQGSAFRYLGSLVSEDGKCDAEIRSRIAMRKARFGQMRRILTSMRLSSEVRLRLLKSYIWSVMLYGCESWTISKEMRMRLEAAEVWFLRM